MRTLRVALVVPFLVATTVAQKPKPKNPPAPGDPIVTGEVGKKLDEIVLASGKDDGGFCGSVLVAVKGEVLLEKGYGLADITAEKPLGRDALWDWASVSKQFTAAALLKLQDQKKLALDDALTRIYRDAPKDKSKVTLRMLLNHTSGMAQSYGTEPRIDLFQREAFEKRTLSLPLVAEPGKKHEYSNSCYALAAAVVEKVSGKTFEEYCSEQLFRPAGMKDACMIGWKDLDPSRVPRIDRGKGFDDEPKSRRFAYGDQLSWGYRGCGGIVATTRDMLQWDRALRGDKLLSAKAKAQLYAPALANYALGWMIRNEGGMRVEHSGSVRGIVTFYMRMLDDDVVVAIACSGAPKSHPQALADALAAKAK
jgi:CubicO group peptidase (beta-lactamase class C family)